MEIITARQAFELGKTRYFTGKPCIHGHVAERMISNGCCVECLNERRARGRADAYERTKVWRLAHPGARAAEARKYRERHPDKVKATRERYSQAHADELRRDARERAARMRAADPAAELERRRRFELKREAERAHIAGRARPTVCDVCGQTSKIVFDHCHATGTFRGWLCDRCNKTLGHVKDDPAILRALASYLEKSK